MVSFIVENEGDKIKPLWDLRDWKTRGTLIVGNEY